jgi:hypothetical protein
VYTAITVLMNVCPRDECLQDDFKNLNPANPVHFFSICKRCYAAVARNNMKVSEKDL